MRLVGGVDHILIMVRNIAMVIADCGRIANGCYHIHHIEVVNMDRGWYGTYTLYGRKID